MRADLPTYFTEELVKDGRYPIQYLIFHFASGDIYVTDNIIFESIYTTLYIVENWGKLSDNVNINKAIQGGGSSTRQSTITLLNTGSDSFSSRFNNESPENIEVSFYQTFNYLDGDETHDPILIDKFVIQDPITFSEASNLLSLDLVSLNQYADPYIGVLDSVTNEFYGITIGAVSGVSGTPYGDHPYVTLDNNHSAATTTIICIEDPVAAGFPASGYIIIDYELISYSALNNSSFNGFLGCTRGSDAGEANTWSSAMWHKSGSLITEKDHEYLWAFGAGPLEFMGPVYIDGDVYTGEHTIYKDRDPVQVGFPDGPPFTKIIDAGISTTIDVTDYGNLDSYSGGFISAPDEEEIKWDCAITGARMRYVIGATNNDSTYMSYLYWTCNIGDGIKNFASFQSGSMSITAWATTYDTGSIWSTCKLVAKYGIYSKTIVTSPIFATGTNHNTEEIELYTWEQISQPMYIYVKHIVSSICNITSESAGVRCWQYEVTYRPDEKDYYLTGITCDLSSGVGSTNPADAIKALLTRIGVGSFTDTTTFDIAKTWFTTNGYEFAGFLPGEMRCRQAIKDMCIQARCELIYNAGVIKLNVRQHLNDKTPVEDIYPENLRIKSVSVVRQNIVDIINKSTIRYDAVNVQEEYQQSYEVSDTDSQDLFGVHELIYDGYLINNTAMAENVLDFWLEETRIPYTIVTFNMYLNAFPLEVGDAVTLHSSFNKFYSFKGDIVNITRQFGSGKSKQINSFQVTIKSNTYDLIEKDNLLDSVYLNDTVILTIHKYLSNLDNVRLTDQFTLEVIQYYGYGNSGYGEYGYGL